MAAKVNSQFITARFRVWGILPPGILE